MDEYKLEDELGGQGGDAEVQPFDPERRQTDDQAGQGRDQSGKGEREPKRRSRNG